MEVLNWCEERGLRKLKSPNIKIGHSDDFESMAEVITRRFRRWARFKEEGGDILYGGNVIKSKVSFVEPTIVRAENHYQIVQDETFAPILYVMKYDDLDEAIKLKFVGRLGVGLDNIDKESIELFIQLNLDDSEIENQFQVLTNKFEEVSFKLDKLSSRVT